MKTLIFGRFVAVLLLLVSITACEKETEELKTAEADKSAELIIKSLVEAAGNQYLSGEVVLAENNEAVSIEREGLVDEYTADNTGLSDDRPKNKLHLCVRSVEPDRDQRQKLSRAFTSYSERNKRIIGAHREHMQNLQQRIMAARTQLRTNLEAGEINREQFRQRMQVLRDRYQEAVTRIRTSNVEAFSRSYTQLLEHLSKILSQEQWESFTACMSA